MLNEPKTKGTKKKTKTDFTSTDLNKQLAACKAQVIIVEDKNKELEHTIFTLKTQIAAQNQTSNLDNNVIRNPATLTNNEQSTIPVSHQCTSSEIENIKIRMELLELKVDQKLLQHKFPSALESRLSALENKHFEPSRQKYI